MKGSGELQERKHNKISKLISNALFVTAAASAVSSVIGIYAVVTILSDRNASDIRRIGVGLIVVMALVFAVSLFIAIRYRIKISKKLDQPVQMLTEAMQKALKGDLSVSLDYSSDDTIGDLVQGFNATFHSLKKMSEEIAAVLAQLAKGDFASVRILDYQGDYAAVSQSFRMILNRLNSVFSTMSSSAQQVDAGSSQISNSAQQLAQGSSEQASSAEELTASITDISQKISENSGHVDNVAQELDKTAADLKNSNEQMQQMQVSMDDISAASNEIRKVIKVIDEIAFQTNILALNAAVEASRAGEAGKGFAVVADEVRSLAGKSAEAAKQTSDLIESSIQKVQSGKALADSTAKNLNSVVKSLASLDQMVQKINEISSAQSSVVSQITSGVEQISSVIQTNSATAEECAAASEELSSQADLLNQEVGKVRLLKEKENVPRQKAMQKKAG